MNKGDRTMAHNIDQMAYVGEMPWHGLGTKVEGEAMSAAKALSLGGLDWEVEKRELQTVEGLPVPGHFAVVRKDREVPLGVVKGRYTCVQNYDCFGFFDTVVGENAAVYHTVGSLGKGERVWIMAKLPQDIVVKDRDVSNLFLLLSASHDGSSPITAKFTPVRVVCQNTLNAALKGKKEVSIRHTGQADIKLREAHKLMGIIKTQLEATQVNYDAMASKMVTTNALDEFFRKVFPENPSAKNNTRRSNIIQTVTNLYHTGKGNVGHSVWDLYNGVTEYVDHHRSINNDGNRWENGVFGSGAAIKEKAMEVALEMVS